MGKMETTGRGSKGVSKWVAELAIMVFAVIIVAAGLYFAFPGLLSNAIGLLFSVGSETTTSISPELQAAIKCAYYRCTKGCESSTTKSIRRGEFKCQDFCDEEDMNTFDENGDGKICDMEAMNYPVRISFSESASMNLDSWGSLTPACSKGEDECWLEVGDCFNPVGYKYIYFLVFPTAKTTCSEYFEATWMQNVKTTCTLEEGDYFLWGTTRYLLGATYNDVIICDKTPVEEIELEPGTTKEVKLPLNSYFYSDVYKIVVTSSTGEATLKVEGWGNILDCLQDHPRVSFTCDEAEHSYEPVCVGESLACGEFSLTFKRFEYPFPPESVAAYAVFDIVYSTASTTTTSTTTTVPV